MNAKDAAGAAPGEPVVALNAMVAFVLRQCTA
jgi:hypothetical protein